MDSKHKECIDTAEEKQSLFTFYLYILFIQYSFVYICKKRGLRLFFSLCYNACHHIILCTHIRYAPWNFPKQNYHLKNVPEKLSLQQLTLKINCTLCHDLTWGFCQNTLPISVLCATVTIFSWYCDHCQTNR